MKKSLLSTALAATLGAIAFVPSAFAASTGTITISGQVVADTCAISVNGGTSNTVKLPTVTTNALGTAGATAGDTSFAIALSGCDKTLTTAAMTFSGSNVDTTNGNLNTTGTGQAGNVQVRLLSGTNVINMHDQTNAPAIALANSTGSTTLTAQYFANGGAASTGAVNTSVGFTLTYN